jgi:hypothetical protein
MRKPFIWFIPLSQLIKRNHVKFFAITTIYDKDRKGWLI